MESIIKYSQDEITRTEIRNFVNEGLQDVYQDKLLDFDATFDELQERYSANE
jgi:hypothetical protein